MGAFAENQPNYAAAGISTFPVVVTLNGDKRPAIAGWQRVGRRGSSALAEKFPDADALGFCPGARSGVTVLDVDSTDERELTAALDRHGSTPIVVRSGSGHFQAWYRHNGEGRKIRLWEGAPVDVLGSGFVVAPPSIARRRRYELLQGGLADLDRLPIMRGLDHVASATSAPPNDGIPALGSNVDKSTLVSAGRRNDALFRFCGRCAHSCASLDDLLTLARSEASAYVPPVDEAEIVRTVRSVWQYRERGELRFGSPGAWFDAAEANKLIAFDQDVFVLLAFLRANNRPASQFIVANGLAEVLRWPRKRLAGARTRLEGSGYIKVARPRSWHSPALYRWNGQ